jgi:hypothetical protein
MNPDVSDNPIGVFQNIGAGISQNPKSQPRQFRVTPCIFLLHLGLGVLAAVDFYDDHLRWAAEVNDVVGDSFLPIELQSFELLASDP